MTELQSIKSIFSKLDDLAESLNKVSESSTDEKVITTADYGIQTLMHVQLVFYAREVELEKQIPTPLTPQEIKEREPTKD